MRLRESALAMASRCTAEVLAGRYRLDARIGSGGAADVHRAFDLRLRRAVAVKVFRAGTGVESEDGFASEAVILARLQHPGLVTAYDAGRHDGRAYLVMQLVEGSTLKARIAEGPLSCEDTAALGADLAKALAHAHEAGVVHRDVKPSNILLDASGRPYLTDFGISRLVDATTRTVTGTLVGTAAYLAPEQVLGQPVGRPADVYALGLVLLECLTGRLEYDGGPLEAAIARLHRPPALPQALPDELASLLRDMTALDEQARPSAPDCARTLAALAGRARSASAASTVLSAPAVPSVHVTSVVGSRDALPGDDATHLDALPAAGRAAAKAAPARSRALAAGGTVALVTVMAAALAVTDVLPSQGSDANTTRTVSRPAESAGPEGGSPGGSSASAAPEVSPPSSRDASDKQLSDAVSLRHTRPASATVNPRSGAPSEGGARAGAKQAAPHQRSGKPEKGAKARKTETKTGKTKQEKPGKTG